ncbi:MAG TPA: GIY-YIG nuclease family protein [Moraxellaceae bacterium]|nr:GIY-YIG nuclease family protein [Moraxellaceae bacterium]
MSWFLYVIECRDGSLYTGIAVDVVARYAAHVAGKGARYTRGRPPVRLLAVAAFPDRSTASRAEYEVKRLSLPGKRQFCEAHAGLAQTLAPNLVRIDPVNVDIASRS